MLFVLLLSLVWLLAYFQVKLWVWTIMAAAFLGYWTAACGGSAAVWLIFVLVATLLNVVPIRRVFVSGPLFGLFRKLLPSMSQTGREALEAGTIWWEGELFSGRPNWQKLLAEPAPVLTPEEQAFLDGPVEELCRMLDDWKIYKELHDLPLEVWQFIKDKGFFGMIIPKVYGGLQFSALAHSQVIMKISSRSITAGVTVMVPNSLGPAELLLNYGTQQQKDYYLPRLAKGKEVPCFALTGPEAGSDAASVPDTGIVCRGRFEGKETLGIRLNWEKRYITLGPVATIMGLAFRLHDPIHFLGDKEDIGITCALVPTKLPGITIGTRHDPLEIPFQNGPSWGKDVFIPIDFIIGGAARAGHGWRMLMETLAAGRGISLPALSTCAGKLTSRTMGAYARIRRQFKLPIGYFEGIEEPLARIGVSTYQMDAARIMTCGAIDQGKKPAVITAIVKYHLTERMRRVVNDGMDIQGGGGISLGPRNFLGRIYQSVPIGITVEGSNILTRSMIIFGQGAIRCHPYIQQEVRAAADPDRRQGLVLFDRALFGHIGFIISNVARTLFLGMTGGWLVKAPGGLTRRYFQKASRLSAAFALLADAALLLLGGNLKRKEKLSGRLADILSNLYLLSAVLKLYEDRHRPQDELPLLKWACEESINSIQESFAGLLRNLPNRPAAWLLRLIIFPLGRPLTGPRDRLGHEVTGILLEPSSARDRLTFGVFLPTSLTEPLGRLEDALHKVIAAEPVEKKLRDAVRVGKLKEQPEAQLLEEGASAGVVSRTEADILRLALAARAEVIRVDDFPKL
ncbi:MAG TPA: acyl-CoA dehydrogenase [Nitrospirota bacterium]|nr:acyl-CoA dehydrogenase [Nitrospirota bacterium]